MVWRHRVSIRLVSYILWKVNILSALCITRGRHFLSMGLLLALLYTQKPVHLTYSLLTVIRRPTSSKSSEQKDKSNLENTGDAGRMRPAISFRYSGGVRMKWKRMRSRRKESQRRQLKGEKFGMEKARIEYKETGDKKIFESVRGSERRRDVMKKRLVNRWRIIWWREFGRNI